MKKRSQAHQKPRKQWDETHKYLFGDAESIYQLLQFVDDDWIQYVRPENITIVSNEFIARELGDKKLKKLMRKISDIVAKISFRSGKEEKTVYIILEHQSTVDYSMRRRLFVYTDMLEQHIRNSKTYQHHWVYPIVLYTGMRKWPQIATEDTRAGSLPSTYRQIFEYPVIDVHRLPHEKILQFHGRVAAYFYLARYNKDLKNEDNCAEFTKHLLNILQHDTGEKVKESLLIMSDVLYNTHISETNVNDYTMKEVIDMITKEGIEILFPWQLRIYKEVKAQVRQETKEMRQETKEMRQEAQQEIQEKRQEIQEKRQEAQQEIQEKRQEIQEKRQEIQEKRQEIQQAGRAEGHIEERRKNARSMFSKGFSAHDIQDVTGLSDDEIRAFQQNGQE